MEAELERFQERTGWRGCGSGTWVARKDGIVGLASTKTAEIVAPKSSLTPCVLDDDPAQLEMLSAVIADMGYEAIATSDPEEALKLVKSGQCRLVLVDVHMPGMDGYQFLDRGTRSDPGVHIILMTGDYTLDSALEAIRRGASDFLPKPIDRVRLKRSGSRDKERSRGAHHSDDGRLHTGFGAGSDQAWSVGFPAETHRPRAVEEIWIAGQGAIPGCTSF